MRTFLVLKKDDVSFRFTASERIHSYKVTFCIILIAAPSIEKKYSKDKIKVLFQFEPKRR